MHECNAHISFLSISSLKSWDLTKTQDAKLLRKELALAKEGWFL
jgi:hypothetical protein